jgi:hypothetical protein
VTCSPTTSSCSTTDRGCWTASSSTTGYAGWTGWMTSRSSRWTWNGWVRPGSASCFWTGTPSIPAIRPRPRCAITTSPIARSSVPRSPACGTLRVTRPGRRTPWRARRSRPGTCGVGRSVRSSSTVCPAAARPRSPDCWPTSWAPSCCPVTGFARSSPASPRASTPTRATGTASTRRRTPRAPTANCSAGRASFSRSASPWCSTRHGRTRPCASTRPGSPLPRTAPCTRPAA